MPPRPLPVIADVFRCQLFWKSSVGPTAANIFHVQAPSSTAGQVYSTIDANVTSGMWGHTPSTSTVTTVKITPLDGVSATSVFAPTGTKWSGPTTVSGDIIPAAAAVLTLRTALRGASHRGRLFLPFPAESQATNGILQASTVSSMNTAWTTFIIALSTASKPMVVASYKLAAAFGIVTYSVEGPFGTIRNRQTRLR